MLLMSQVFESAIDVIARYLVPSSAAIGAIASALIAYKVYRTENSPDVIVYIESCPENARVADLVIKNIGNAPAYDVKCKIEPALISFDEEIKSFNTIALLPPDGHRAESIDVFSDLIKQMRGKECKAFLEYSRNKKGKKVRVEFVIECESFARDSRSHSFGELRLQDIAGELEEIKKLLKQNK